MADVGSLDKRINSQGYQVHINTGAADEYIFMQNASMSISHSEFREPTTSGINVYYSGLPDNVLSGTLLFTTDFGNSNTDAALEDLLAATNGGEYPIKPIFVKLIDNQSTAQTTTFEFTQSKLTSCTIYKGQEGAVKADVTFVLFGNPTITVAQVIKLLEYTISRLRQTRDRVNSFIDRNIVDWAQTEMLTPAQKDLLQAGLSQEALDGLSINKTGFMKISLAWRYIKDGKPIHFYIEYDTRPHWIEAKGRLNGGSEFLTWTGKDGRQMFAKKVFHPGTTGKHLIENAAKEYKPFLKQRIMTETNNFMKVNRL